VIYADHQPQYIRKARERRVRERQEAARAYQLHYGTIAYLMCDVLLELSDELSELSRWEKCSYLAIELSDRLEHLAETDPDYEAFKKTNNLVIGHLAARVSYSMTSTHPFLDPGSDDYMRVMLRRSRHMAENARLRLARRIRKLTYTGKRRAGVPEPKFSGPGMIVRRNSK